MKKSESKLFEEFPEASKSKWRDEAEKDLSGRALEKLNWNTYDGFSVEPFYTEEDLADVLYLTGQSPGNFPYSRGGRTGNNLWKINETISAPDAQTANMAAINAIESGVTSLSFLSRLSGNSIYGIPLFNKTDINALLKDIPLSYIPVHFKCGDGAVPILALLIASAGDWGDSPEAISGSVDADPLKSILLAGSAAISGDGSFKLLSEALDSVSRFMPGFRIIKVHGDHFDRAGASIAQQLAFTLAGAVEYIDRLTDYGLEIDTICRHMGFLFPVGSNYFTEIAKIRAARTLWAHIINLYRPGDESSKIMHIEAETSLWNKSVYDPYVNTLRGTVEAMSGIMGGVYSMTVFPFNSTFKKQDEFSRRMARNTQLILKNESYLDKVIDPSAGSYYIEQLTDKISNKAWDIFLQTEKAGGLTESARSGFVQTEIEKTRQSRDMDIATRKASFIGVNKYPSSEEKMAGKIEETEYRTELDSDNGSVPRTDSFQNMVTYLSEEGCGIEKIIDDDGGNHGEDFRPLTQYRGPEAFEKLRLATERFAVKAGGAPKVFLLQTGNISMRSARATFSSNFFGCAGFDILSGPAYDNALEGADAALESGAGIIVICSSDAEYLELAPVICGKLREKNPDIKIIIAGNPKDNIEEFREAGVDDFIHLRSNALQTLRKYQDFAGIYD